MQKWTKVDKGPEIKKKKKLFVFSCIIQISNAKHYENKVTKNIRPTDILQILNKLTKYLVNVLKFTKYLVNSYHQKGVKHYVLTNWYQMTTI